MCGRYTLTKLEQIVRLFPGLLDMPCIVPRYNIAPTQAVPVVTNQHSNRVELMHWGLIPSWAKDPAIGNRMINARAETLAEKPAFRTALRRRRCLLPADGFYEWRREPDGKTKTPMLIRLKDGEPFALAGLWDVWHDATGSEIASCTIITTTPNELTATVHERMPVILPREKFDAWLTKEEQDADDLTPMLAPYPASKMELFPVSRRVNSPANDDARLIEPVEEEGLFR